MNEILVLGSATPVMETLVGILTSTNRRIRSHCSLAAAAPVLSWPDIAAIFCFYNFDDGTVLDVLKKLKQSGRSVPIVVITDFTDSERAAKAISNGAVEYLPVPLDPAEVSACAARVLGEGTDEMSVEHVRFEAQDGVLVMQFPRELNHASAQILEQLLVDGIPTIENGIVLNLSETRYFSSNGVSMLFVIRRTFARLDDRLIIAGAKPHVRNILHLAGVDAFYRFVDSVEDGIAAIHREQDGSV